MHPSFHNSGSRNKSFSLQVLVSCTVMRSVVFHCWNLYSHNQVSNWWDGLQDCRQKRTSPNILRVFRSEKYHNLLAEIGKRARIVGEKKWTGVCLMKGTCKPTLVSQLSDSTSNNFTMVDCQTRNSFYFSWIGNRMNWIDMEETEECVLLSSHIRVIFYFQTFVESKKIRNRV